ncbi:MAG: metallophosphatase family protein [Candidatus Omnitrophica bacterium]|nr:metallophosphatase family protein [Candidatus Omnitrophota bacterium]
MRYGIFADIHSNIEALEAVLTALESENIDKYLCVGDVIGYAANPCECIKRVKEIASVCVAGNHDWAAIGKFNLDFFNPLAKTAIVKNSLKLSEEDKKFLDSLKLTYENEDLTLVHGTLQDAASFHYLRGEFEAVWTCRLMETPVCFVGHTHIPQIFEFRNYSSISELFTSELRIEANNKYIVNVGSVGQPRDNDSRACYCVFDAEKGEISLKRSGYDIKGAQGEMLKAGMPEFLARRLTFGQ